MPVYFIDSSALVKRYINETGSSWVVGLFDTQLNNEVFIAAITGVEMIAAITLCRINYISLVPEMPIFRANSSTKIIEIEKLL